MSDRMDVMVAEPIRQVTSMLDRYGRTEVIGPASIYDTVAETIEAFHAAGVTAPSAVMAGPDDGATPSPSAHVPSP